MTKGQFRVGIIGAGSVARQFHLPGWTSIPGVTVAAIADIDRAAASVLAQAHGIPHVFADFQELLRLDLDAVDICVPNQVHAQAVKAALEAGRNVICEKPLAVTAREVKEMGELADRKGLKLMTAQHYRFGSQALAVSNWARAGNLGKVYHARARAMRRASLPTQTGFIDKRLSGGGPCMDIGIHALDMALWLMDFPNPVRVSGTAKVNFAKGWSIPGMWGEWNRDLFSVEDFAAGMVHFDNGATLMLEAAWLGHQAESEELGCQVFGTNGGLKWPSAEFATVQGGAFLQGTLTCPWDIRHPHTEELRAFRDCVAGNTPSPVPWTQSLKAIAILEAIYLSQEKNREVEVSLGIG